MEQIKTKGNSNPGIYFVRANFKYPENKYTKNKFTAC